MASTQATGNGAVNSATVADDLGADKATWDGAAAGTSLVDNRVTIEGIKSWLPGFKFLGMGLLLAGITFLVATILGTLRHLGYRVQTALGRDPVFPAPPGEARIFPMIMMTGLMLLIGTFVVAIVVSQRNWIRPPPDQHCCLSSGLSTLKQPG